jgi:hypothetical protein
MQVRRSSGLKASSAPPMPFRRAPAVRHATASSRAFPSAKGCPGGFRSRLLGGAGGAGARPGRDRLAHGFHLAAAGVGDQPDVAEPQAGCGELPGHGTDDPVVQPAVEPGRRDAGGPRHEPQPSRAR